MVSPLPTINTECRALKDRGTLQGLWKYAG
jgi:hypothetical protein